MFECTLREKKHARTKIAIMTAFINALEKTKFDDISIRQICKEVEISEGTFFNYFSEKIDIIHYYSQLFFIKIIWRAKESVPQEKFPDFINAVFQNMAEELGNVNVAYQMLSLLIVQKEKPKKMVITDIERHIVFPDCAGIENIPVVLIDEYLKSWLKDAHNKGLIPSSIDIDDLLVSLITILTGTILALKYENLKGKSYHYLRQLNILWKSLGIKYNERIR